MNTFCPLQQLHDCRRLPQMEPRRTYHRRQQKRKLLLLLLLPLFFSRKGSPSDEDGTSTTSSLLPIVYPAREISATRSSFGMPKFVCDSGKGSRRRKCMSHSSELFIAQDLLHVLEANGFLEAVARRRIISSCAGRDDQGRREEDHEGSSTPVLQFIWNVSTIVFVSFILRVILLQFDALLRRRVCCIRMQFHGKNAPLQLLNQLLRTLQSLEFYWHQKLLQMICEALQTFIYDAILDVEVWRVHIQALAAGILCN
ncbi:hypothetical protein CY35_03G108500 [Sphagnum magellanicum]|nr:hypothetical protein CY35_03G108500 [Sphagnum magellanicum]